MYEDNVPVVWSFIVIVTQIDQCERCTQCAKDSEHYEQHPSQSYITTGALILILLFTECLDFLLGFPHFQKNLQIRNSCDNYRYEKNNRGKYNYETKILVVVMQTSKVLSLKANAAPSNP
ncbi:unnamed protein product [Owenia fusiformis]|uniref:Uncharacterized protein n=1 Tax=Owenia fusiformis TaxID=6347 RepID=A0A8S4PKD6_OWEFU|nr:unnamed protein product [Owenia fusiformis]